MKWLRRFAITLIVLAILFTVLVLVFPPARHGFSLIGLLLDDFPHSLPVPVQGITPSQLADTWGAPRSGGRTHKGIDIFAKRETPILSATEGIVLRKGENRLGGRTITIIGPAGWRHYYAHMERYTNHEIGDWVEQGEVIGYVGNSGNARTTPTHLHYGIYELGGPAHNPYPYLTR